jgi:hypothetical protein
LLVEADKALYAAKAVPLEMLLPAQAKVVATPLGDGRGAVAVNDGYIE